MSAPYQVEKRRNHLKKQLMESMKADESYQQYTNSANKIKQILQDNYQVLYAESELIDIIKNNICVQQSREYLNVNTI